MADPDREAQDRLSAGETASGRSEPLARPLLDDAELIDLRDQPWSWPFHSLLRRLERRLPQPDN